MSTDVLETMHRNLDRLPATTGRAWLEGFLNQDAVQTAAGDDEEALTNLGKLYVAMFGYPTNYCTYLGCGWTTFKYLNERYPSIKCEVPTNAEEYRQGLIKCGVPATLAEKAASIRFSSPPYSESDRLVIEQVRLILAEGS